jgi:hypothetical protein
MVECELASENDVDILKVINEFLSFFSKLSDKFYNLKTKFVSIPGKKKMFIFNIYDYILALSLFLNTTGVVVIVIVW